VPGFGWSPVKVISTVSDRASYCPSLDVDPSGNVHVAWADFADYMGSGNDFNIFYRRYLADSFTWTSTEIAYDGSTPIDWRCPSLSADSDGNAHITWSDKTTYGGSGSDRDILYRKYVPGSGWGILEVVSSESAVDSVSPTVAADRSGVVHFAWEDTINGPIQYKRWIPGSAWTPVGTIASGLEDRAHDPALAADPCCSAHLVWDEINGTTSGIWYARYEDQSPSQESGLVQHWKLEEGAGTYTFDAVNPSVYGIIYGPEWVPRGRFNALRFGGEAEYVNLPRAWKGALPTELSVFAWLRSSMLPEFGPALYQGDDVEYILFTNDASEVVFGLRFVEGGDPVWTTVSAVVAPDTWHAVAGVWTGSEVLLYVDGERVDNNFPGSSELYDPDLALHRIGLGTYEGTSAFFEGDIDEVRLYDRVLTADELICLSMWSTVQGLGIPALSRWGIGVAALLLAAVGSIARFRRGPAAAL
jgi:hypothetical protein